MTDLALPRARVRRRRRRPFGPVEWMALAYVLLGSTLVAACVVAAVVRDIPHGDIVMVVLEALGIVEGSFFVWLAWPVLRDWWEGEE